MVECIEQQVLKLDQPGITWSLEFTPYLTLPIFNTVAHLYVIGTLCLIVGIINTEVFL